VIPEITLTIVFDELPRPPFDKKVFSIGMIESAENGEDMPESQAQISKPEMLRKFQVPPSITRTSKEPECFCCKGMGENSN